MSFLQCSATALHLISFEIKGALSLFGATLNNFLHFIYLFFNSPKLTFCGAWLLGDGVAFI